MKFFRQLESIAELTGLVTVQSLEDGDTLDGVHVLLTMRAVAIDDDVREGVTIELPNLAVGFGADVSSASGIVQEGELTENVAGLDGLENLKIS